MWICYICSKLGCRKVIIYKPNLIQKLNLGQLFYWLHRMVHGRHCNHKDDNFFHTIKPSVSMNMLVVQIIWYSIKQQTWKFSNAKKFTKAFNTPFWDIETCHTNSTSNTWNGIMGRSLHHCYSFYIAYCWTY